MRLLPLVAALLAQPLSAHELWIEPTDFQPELSAPVEAHLVNGQEFKGLQLSFLPGYVARLDLSLGDAVEKVAPRIGSKPALQAPALGDGLHVAVYQSVPATVKYASLEKFGSFVRHKDLGDALDRHAARGLPDADFAEVYTRFSKSLIGVGSAAGADHDFGLETELVALANPYTDDMSGGLPLRLTYRGEIRADAQVEIFDRAPSGEVTITRPLTNADGVVTVPVTPGHHYMADAVVLREPEGENLTGAVWESLWANLTWAVPGP
ncbi:MAG: hypothetical protein RLZZ528_2341 [Pseudomonadota bacterium]|jgi:hypothetical protein